MHIDELESLHCWQPFEHIRTHWFDTKFVPTMQVRHCEEFVGLQVLQLPWQLPQTPPFKLRLSKHCVQTVVDEHFIHPIGHGLHVPLVNKNLEEHYIQVYGFNGLHEEQPGLHCIGWLLNITNPFLATMHVDIDVHVTHADEHGWHVLFIGW